MLHLLNPLTIPRGDNRYLRFTQEVACLSTDSVGDFVCVRDLPVNGKWRVHKANPFDESKMPAIGVLISKSTPTVGIIQLIGPLVGMYSGLDHTLPCFVGESGLVQEPPPVDLTNTYAFVQQIGFATDTTDIFLSGSIAMTKKKL